MLRRFLGGWGTGLDILDDVVVVVSRAETVSLMFWSICVVVNLRNES